VAESVYGPWILSGLKLGHFAGIIFGIGAATLLDFIILRFVVLGRILPSVIRIVEFSSKFVTVGLVLLWLSGVGFFVYYGFYDPSKLSNPKLVAKVIIVGVLTVNAFFIHCFVLPQISEQLGRRLLDGLSQFHCTLLLMIGTISVISWYVPLVLGIVSQLNNVAAERILADYSMLVILVNLAIQTVMVIYLYGTNSQRG